INLDMVGRLRPVKEGMWPEVLGCLSVLEARGLPGMLPLSVVLQDIQKDWYSPKEKLIVQGIATAKNFDVLLAQLNRKFDFKLTKLPGGIGPSDHSSFYAKRIPGFFFFTGDHNYYHRPCDTADKINMSGMRKVADLDEELAERLMHVPDH